MAKDVFFILNGGTVRSVQELSEHINTFGGRGIARVYLRGQSNVRWGLVPSIGREHCYIGKSIIKFDLVQERNLLHRFRRRAYAHYNRVIGDWEAIFLARHHGLPVRLLDWTANPLVALYNACVFERNPETDGAIWAFLPYPKRQENYIDIFTEERSPLDIPGVRIVYPYDVSPRMPAQASIFTIQQYPDVELQKYNPQLFQKSDFDLKKLVRWRIPKKYKEKIMEYLYRSSINARTLFPDLDGLARGLWQSEVTRYGKSIRRIER